MAAMTGFLSRFVWIYPNWLSDEVTENETVQLGYYEIAEKGEPIFCECHTLSNHKDTTCLYINYTLLETEPEVQINRQQCNVQSEYISEIMSEDIAEKQLYAKLDSHDNLWTTWIRSESGSKLWLSGNQPVIWDIDLDYFGCEQPADFFVNAGFTWRVVELIDLKLGKLFCPRIIDHEHLSDVVMKRLIKETLKICSSKGKHKCNVPFKNIFSSTEGKLLAYWKNFPAMFCVKNDQELKKVWKDLIYIIYHLTMKQLRLLLSVGFCFNYSPKTYAVTHLLRPQICHGANPPGTRLVQTYLPSIEDINERLGRLEYIMTLLPPPSLISIARSSRDGYVPRQFVEFIEKGAITAIKKTQSNTNFQILYDEDLLGGEEGWFGRLDIMGGETVQT